MAETLQNNVIVEYNLTEFQSAKISVVPRRFKAESYYGYYKSKLRFSALRFCAKRCMSVDGAHHSLQCYQRWLKMFFKQINFLQVHTT